MGHILIAEDDANMSALLTAYLERDGFRVMACRDGREALRRARSDPPQLVILDIMLPEIDGWEVCRQLRREGSVPIIMLTARIDEADRIAGLRLGADDYVVKPFSPAEVVERVRAVLRRSDGNASNAGAVLTFDGLVLSSERYTLALDGTAIAVTLSEFRIIEALMRAPGRVFSREQLLEVIGESEAGVIDRAIDVHIVNLRKKLGAAQQQYIETVRGVGYRLKARQQA